MVSVGRLRRLEMRAIIPCVSVVVDQREATLRVFETDAPLVHVLEGVPRLLSIVGLLVVVGSHVA